jgi:hypothetical protein
MNRLEERIATLERAIGKLPSRIAVGAAPAGVTLYDETPERIGYTGSVGSAQTAAPGDHVHPGQIRNSKTNPTDSGDPVLAVIWDASGGDHTLWMYTGGSWKCISHWET